MNYIFLQVTPIERWAIMDYNGTQICEGPPEQAETGKAIMSLLNDRLMIEARLIEAVKVNIIRALKKLPGSNGRRAEDIIRSMK